MTINTANIHFNHQGTPFASDFDDVYFSNQSGLLETQYVFLQNNQMAERLITSEQKKFVIAETGFGTGLNFLATLMFYHNLSKQHDIEKLPKLHFISVEKYPLVKSDLIEALQPWSELSDYAQTLIEQYPLMVEGCHRSHYLNGNITLDLWLGDVADILPNLTNKPEGVVDAWFLDGFAPSKNPTMWNQQLFQQMARLSRNKATFATFTAAGFVRRGLTEAGFDVEKRPGFGKKREMLAGMLNCEVEKTDSPNTYFRTPYSGTSSQPTVAIIGAGLAGANCAYSLALRGYKVDLYYQDALPAMGASGNPQGGFYPQLNTDMSHLSQIQALSFIYAKKRYQNLLNNGFTFPHQWCGVLQLAFNENTLARHNKMQESNLWPLDLLTAKEASECSEIAQLDIPYKGLFIPQGGWINPPELIQALLSAAAQLTDVTHHPKHQLFSIDSNTEHSCLNWQDGSTSTADITILCNGADITYQKNCKAIPFQGVRGQVESIPTSDKISSLNTVLCHKGYFTPQFNGTHALGSTYVKNDMDTSYRSNEQSTNRRMHEKALSQVNWLQGVNYANHGRAAIRCTVPDHLPVVGAIPNEDAQRTLYKDLYKALPDHRYAKARDLPNLFVMSALGSRGLTTAPLMAELLVSQIDNEPLPFPNQLSNALNPNRFLLRNLIRRIS